MKNVTALAFLVALGLVLSACGVDASADAPTGSQTVSPASLAATVTRPTSRPTATFTNTPTATPSQTPTSTPSATATASPIPSSTATPSPTPTPLHPLSIEAMRQADYPGSEITIQETLDSGANYDRFIASYLSEGLRIYGLLTIPRGEMPESGWPLILFNHGYIPPEVYRTTERYVAYQDTFARNGYITFKSDYRGHGDSEGRAQGGYGSPDYTIDVLNALGSLKTMSEVDSDRIGMWGHSMGGYITLRAMVIDDDIKAGVIWAGVVVSYPDLLSRWRRTPEGQPTPTPNPRWGGWRQRIIETYGSPEENPEFWNSISSNSYLEDLSGPIQLHHGTADHSVPLEFSEILNQEILAVGGAVEMYIYDGDDHNLSNSFNQAMQRSVQFFDTYVKNGSP